MRTIARPILKIREVTKDIKFDSREERIPKVVFKKFIQRVESVIDIRVEGMVTYPICTNLTTGNL